MNVLQPWVDGLSMMQQTVLLTAIRGPDGLPKYHTVKFLLRWYRRCILYSALDKCILTDPCDKRGGSFTGPGNIPPLVDDGNGGLKDMEYSSWEEAMEFNVKNYIAGLDEVPHHFQLYLIHAIEILGYKHPDIRIRSWWHKLYIRLVHDMHLFPESKELMDKRLGDTKEGWLERADIATQE